MEKTEKIRKLFNRSLYELAEVTGNSEYAGIYSPGYSEQEIARFMSDHYKTDEGVQSQNFELYDFYEGLIDKAMVLVGADMAGDYNILELGAGFGSATFPILKLFPNSLLAATELSLPMLARLKTNLVGKEYYGRCLLLQLNAEELDFGENSFDFIIGTAILHHLFNPEVVYEQAIKILKPGGYAVFFEPFAEGYGILSDFYNGILKESGFSTINDSFISKVVNRLMLMINFNGQKIDKYLANYLYNSVLVWDKMMSHDKDRAFFTNADDKWLFTKQYYLDIQAKYGFSECKFFGVTTFDEVFRTHPGGNTKTPMPDWIKQKFELLANSYSTEKKNDLFTEGCIIMKK